MKELEYIYEKIGYTFKNSELLKNALTHSSYGNENSCENNERLEFLGDSVLSIIISDRLYKTFSDIDEGRLSKMRASLVCEHSLDMIASKINLGEFILLGRGEDRNGGRKRPSVVSDAFEALIAAIYLDSGMENASKWVISLFEDELAKIENDRYFGDYKTELQEIIQKDSSTELHYEVVSESGMDHLKEFVVRAVLDGKEIGIGKGKSKKEAEQRAAEEAVRGFKNEAL